MDNELFHSVSIRGKYLYGYCCLLNTIHELKLKAIYKPLDIILQSFVETDKLDEWQERADQFMPSKIMEVDFPLTHPVVSTHKDSNELIEYYYAQPIIVLNIIEELIWLGISNLYGGFNSEYSFPYLVQIIKYMEEDNIEFPYTSILARFSVSEERGWGKRININSILSEYGYG